jgi:hypothetical protein
MPTHRKGGGPGKVTNETLADRFVMGAVARVSELAVERFPALNGTPYAHLNEVAQADFQKKNTLAYFEFSRDGAHGKIVVGNHVPKAMTEETVAHEIGHSLSEFKSAGLRNVRVAYDMAFNEYKKTHPRTTRKSFSRSISDYAATAKAEAFAEAFADYHMNGENAKEASKLIIAAWQV